MDETPLSFDTLGNKMVDFKGVKRVDFKNTRHGKTKAVVLSCSGSGTTLKRI